MDIQRAIEVFEKTDGFFQTQSELLKVFRGLCFKRHPDCGGTQEQFIELQSAYECLKNKVKEIDHKVFHEKTIEGDLIGDLGKGFSISEHDVGSCDVCGGEGYHKYHDEGPGLGIFEECPTCKGVGLFSYECKFCKGTGVYQKTEKHTSITCKRCGGTGRFYPVNKFYPINFDEKITEEEVDTFIYLKNSEVSWASTDRFFMRSKYNKQYMLRQIPYNRKKIGVGCKTCFGFRKIERKEEGRYYYSTCYNCGGVGEVKLNLFNPVLRKGGY